MLHSDEFPIVSILYTCRILLISTRYYQKMKLQCGGLRHENAFLTFLTNYTIKGYCSKLLPGY